MIMRHRSSVVAGVTVALLAVLGLADSDAHGSPVTSGVTWLITHQAPSGLWGTDKQTPFRDATVVLDVLSRVDADSTVVAAGLNAVDAVVTNSTDYLARKIIAHTSVENGAAPGYLVDSLANTQNSDGGWGYQKGYGSNNIETILALRALKAALYSNMTKLGQGVTYLTSHQNGNGGWSFISGDSSRVFFTAEAVITLTMLKGDFNVSTAILNAVNWLKTQDHGDGGFGTGGVSNPYETGLALAAIAKGDPAAVEVTNAKNYLESAQLPDGSWNEDAYGTAEAVYGLIHVAPDLAVLTSDIVLSNPTPVDSDIVNITVTVRNLGVQRADTILVRIFDGDPATDGAQIGSDKTIATLLPAGSSAVAVTWNTLHLAGDHKIYVVVDPLDRIAEPEELNNTAYKSVHVYFPPDLVIEDNGIVFDPPEPDPGEEVIIRVTVKNSGERTALNVPLQIWDGDPDYGGILLYTYNISSIASNSQFIFNLNMDGYFATEGDYYIYACADRNNAIREIYEWNNCNLNTLHVGIQSRIVTLNSGLNLLGLPLLPVESATSLSMISQIPGCSEIDGWDRSRQFWLSAIDDGTANVLGDLFSIDMRDGFFARVTGSGSVDFRGRPVTQHECTQLSHGFNAVSIPNEDACYTGNSLIADIDSCSEARSWDRDLQSWRSDDFPVTPGNGYFVKVSAAGEWCTRTCDTLAANLPDLLVTTDDIFIDPNPVPSGTEVGIYVNFQNIGTDTAFTPRLDIYAGNPAAGGQLLIGGNIPVDIPPDSSGGYWGQVFIFTGSGTVDIYGIADYYNTIPELVETNNQAVKQLHVVAAAPGAFSPSVIQSGSVLRQMASQDARAATTLEPPGGTSPVSADDPPQSEGAGNQRHLVALGSPLSPRVAGIHDVAVGNSSSSSATVAWVTDDTANGCVNYGLTPALGLSACQSAPDGELHSVTLLNLLPNTTYYFEVVSGTITDDNNGSHYTVRSAAVDIGVPSVLYGRVVSVQRSDTIPQYVLAFGSLKHGAISSGQLISETNSDGSWLLNLGNLKNTSSGNALPYAAGDSLFLEFRGEAGKSRADTVLLSGLSPQDCGVSELLQAACGDCDAEGSVNIADVVYLVNYIFTDGPPPLDVRHGDVDCGGDTNIADAVYLVSYIFTDGPAPCAGCP